MPSSFIFAQLLCHCAQRHSHCLRPSKQSMSHATSAYHLLFSPRLWGCLSPFPSLSPRCRCQTPVASGCVHRLIEQEVSGWGSCNCSSRARTQMLTRLRTDVVAAHVVFVVVSILIRADTQRPQH